MGKILKFDQAIFGYDEGHRALFSSLQLTPYVYHFLSTVTDGSGPENSKHFEGALTGLAVPKSDFYAIFCTWSAPEMPRPGCVWSHVILLQLPDLAVIPDLSIFLPFFEKPSKTKKLTDYSKQLEVQLDADIPSPPLAKRQISKIDLILSPLYENPGAGLVVLDEKADDWSNIILKFWSQQWPRLRREFAFSAGSLGDRRLSGIRFDLQVAPLSSIRVWKRSQFPTTLIDSDAQTNQIASVTWLSLAREDLIHPNEKLRTFLQKYGSDVKSPRRAFKYLISSYLTSQLANEEEPESGLLQIAEHFPEPSDAISLKKDQLIALLEGTENTNSDCIWRTFCFLLLNKQASAFERIKLNFLPHIPLLWRYKRSDTLALLGNLPESERAISFLESFSNSLTGADLPIICREQGNILIQILRFNPRLVASQEGWKMPEFLQRQVWIAAADAIDDPLIWADVCIGMLKAKCAVRVNESVALAGDKLLSKLQKWLVSSDFELPSHEWKEAFRDPLMVGIENPLPPDLLALTTWVMKPRELCKISPQREDVQELAVMGLSSFPKELRLNVSFWMTALGFLDDGAAGARLLVASFAETYKAVADSQYPSAAWDVLSSVLPDLRSIPDWDRCKRLRHALRAWIEDKPNFRTNILQSLPANEKLRIIKGGDLNKYKS